MGTARSIELANRVLDAPPGKLDQIEWVLDGVLVDGHQAESESALCQNMPACLRAAMAGGLARCVEAGGRCRVVGGVPREANEVMPAVAAAAVVKAVQVAMAAAAARIEGKVDVVLKRYQEVATAKERLEKMLAEGLFAFTRKVDPTSFKVLCCVLAEGDVAKASRTLGMPDGSIRTLMRRWRGMGKPYRVMLDLVRWRKAVGGKETVALNDNVLLGQTKSSDHPALAADLLERVTEMTGDNWREKAEELEEMLRVAVQ